VLDLAVHFQLVAATDDDAGTVGRQHVDHMGGREIVDVGIFHGRGALRKSGQAILAWDFACVSAYPL